MPDRRAHWDAVYASRDEDAVSWFEPDARARVALIVRHVPDRSAALLDVGSGRTRLIPALVAAGYRDVTALDISAEAVARARTAPGVEPVAWVVADVAAWAPERAYALWHDRAVLHFLTEPVDRDGYRRALGAGTARGSVAILSAFAPDGPTRCSRLPVRRYGQAEFEAFLGSRFATLESAPVLHRTPRGAEQRFHLHVARRMS
jgi:trans-aconitate methyltransferase